MITISPYHPSIDLEEKEASALSSLIRQYVAVQAIFLLGSTEQYRKTTSIFSYDTPTASHTAYNYILVLIEKEDEQSINTIQDKLENNLQHFIPSTIIVQSTDAFFQSLLRGNTFAVDVLSKAAKLYQSEEIIFPIPTPINSDEVKRSNEALYKQTKQKMEGFLASAELHKLRQEYKLAAFMLHQAAEQALSAMLMINTGLKLGTHSIDKLLRCCSMFCYELPDLFPKQNEKEKKLYQLLNRAYIDTRYKEDYNITYYELTALMEKGNRIKDLFEKYANPK
jgi:HEPN domain-containing protein